MKTKESKRIFYTEEDKRFYLTLLTKAQRSGKPKTVKEVSKQYLVNTKSLYEWLRLSKLEGDKAFNKVRGPINSKSKNQELQDEIFSIALLNPMFNTEKIIDSLPTVHRRITAPTVQRILITKMSNSLRRFGTLAMAVCTIGTFSAVAAPIWTTFTSTSRTASLSP